MVSDKIYNVIYIGFGPATIFSILSNPIKDSLVIEKGKCIKDRDPKEVLFGSGGAGAFSDSKLVANPVVGGDIGTYTAHCMPDQRFYEYADLILNYYNEWSSQPGYSYNWIQDSDYSIVSDKLTLLKSKVCHVGTDNSKKIFENIERDISEWFTPINFEEEVVEIMPLEDRTFQVTTKKGIYYSKKVVVAVGKRSDLVNNLKADLNIKNWVHNKTQIGVRVEAPITPKIQELLNKFYDFKLVMKTELGKWRTFCVCGKDAYVAVERNSDFISANGAANADKGRNGLVNFGVMGELDLNLSREMQGVWARAVNDGTSKLLAQNINDFINNTFSEKLEGETTLHFTNYRLGNLWQHLPKNVLYELSEFLEVLQKELGLTGHFFAPEMKLTNPLMPMNGYFDIYPGIHLAGDCSGYTRSIIQAGISGIVIGEALKEWYTTTQVTKT